MASFNALQNYGSSTGTVHYYVFDVLVLAGRDVTGAALSARRVLLQRHILPNLYDPIRHAPQFDASLADLINAVRKQRLEGLSRNASIACTNQASVPAPGKRYG